MELLPVGREGMEYSDYFKSERWLSVRYPLSKKSFCVKYESFVQGAPLTLNEVF